MIKCPNCGANDWVVLVHLDDGFYVAEKESGTFTHLEFPFVAVMGKMRTPFIGVATYLKS